MSSKKIDPKNKRILILSDLHIPYHHQDTIPFLRALHKKYKFTRQISVGDECFPDNSEILTSSGWKTFREVVDAGTYQVAQWEETGKISFVTPERYVDKAYDGPLLRIEHRNYLSLTTPKHNIVKLHPVTGKAHRREAWDYAGSHSWEIPRFGTASGPGIKLADAEIQLQVAFQADGTWDKGGAKFGFTKQRKIDDLRTLLEAALVPFNERACTRGDTVFYIEKANVPAYLSKTFDPSWVGKLSLDQRQLFVRELVYWDGTTNGVGIRYTCTVPENLSIVQAIVISSGLYCAKVSGNYIDIHLERQEGTAQKSCEITEVPYKGRVSCVTVPSGMIVVRQEGFVTVSGNCDKHALSFHDSDPDLMSAGDELQATIKQLQPLYKLFPRLDLVDSNHGSMIYRKGLHHGVPRKYIRSYGEVLDAPKGWKWSNDLTIRVPGGEQVYICHGLSSNIMKVVAQRGMCVIQGHYHTLASIGYLGNPNHLLWGLQVGCSIDSKALAFAYDRLNVSRPIISHGGIIDGQPRLFPMILDGRGRWTKFVP